MTENKKLLESFYQLIGEIGYNEVGIRKLSEISGVEEEIIYERYKNKENLLLELMNYIYMKEKAILFNLNADKPLKEELIEKGISFIKLNRYDRHYSAFKSQILMVALTNDEIKINFEKLIEQYIEQFSSIVEKLKKEYNLEGVENISYLPYELYFLLDSLILYENYKKNLSSERIWEQYIKRILGN